MSVKVRIAPSPTGNLHIGTARTALFNWLYARKHDGQFILRVEDTDTARSTKDFETNIIEGLKWLGLDWDNAELYRQSERLPIYKKYLQELLDSGAAFWREYSAEEKAVMEKEGRAVRDKVIVLKEDGDPERKITFDDMIRGEVSVQAKNVGQVVLAKDLDTPLYNFAVVVDDVDMGITQVIRGEDHISNTPKQLLIYKALMQHPPQFAHLPLILGPDRSKMSKRHGATNVADYQKDYLADALVNFMGHLGHTYENDILTRDEMIMQFSLEKVHKSGAIFDVQKLNWFNAQYIKKLSAGEFRALIGQPELSEAAIPLMTERLEKLSDIAQFAYFWTTPDYDPALLIWKKDDRATTLRALGIVHELAKQGPLKMETLDGLAAEQFAASKGSVYWPLRVALSGQANSAGPLEIAAVLGVETVATRLGTAITKLSA